MTTFFSSPMASSLFLHGQAKGEEEKLHCSGKLIEIFNFKISYFVHVSEMNSSKQVRDKREFEWCNIFSAFCLFMVCQFIIFCDFLSTLWHFYLDLFFRTVSCHHRAKWFKSNKVYISELILFRSVKIGTDFFINF